MIRIEPYKPENTQKIVDAIAKVLLDLGGGDLTYKQDLIVCRDDDEAVSQLPLNTPVVSK